MFIKQISDLFYLVSVLSPRAFQASYSSPNQVLQCMSGRLPREPIGMQPLKVSVENLAGHKGSGYRFSPLDQPQLMLPGENSTTGQRQEGVLEAAAEAAGRQAAAVESHCDDMLRQIKALCHKVTRWDVISEMYLGLARHYQTFIPQPTYVLKLLQRQVAGGASESAALRAENERLLKELHELSMH